MERAARIELATSALGRLRSTAELRPLNLVRLSLRPAQDNLRGQSVVSRCLARLQFALTYFLSVADPALGGSLVIGTSGTRLP